MLDEKDEFESKRNMTEYAASFSEPEAVQKIVSARDNALEVSDDSLRDAIRSISGPGRELDLSKVVKSDGKIHSTNVKTAVQDYANTQESDVQDDGKQTYKDWMDIDLE